MDRLWIPELGKNLIMKWNAGIVQREIDSIWVGSGQLQSGDDPNNFTSMINPVMQVTSNVPIVSDGQTQFIIEARNDGMDIGASVTAGFNIFEYAVFAPDPDEGIILLIYGSLGVNPDWMPPLVDGLTVRRYPISIGLGDGDVFLNFPANAFVTAHEVSDLISSISGTGVTGIRGAAEPEFRSGDVVLTAANLGLDPTRVLRRDMTPDLQDWLVGVAPGYYFGAATAPILNRPLPGIGTMTVEGLVWNDQWIRIRATHFETGAVFIGGFANGVWQTWVPADGRDRLALTGGTVNGRVNINRQSPITDLTAGGFVVGSGQLDLTTALPGVAFLELHRVGAFAVRFGLDFDNQLKFGGVSAGAVAHRIYHDGNVRQLLAQLPNI